MSNEDLEVMKKQIAEIHSIFFGDQNKPGLCEDNRTFKRNFKIIFTSIGVLGTSTIAFLSNLILHFIK